MSLTLGEIVELSSGERFKVERMLGSGGFGKVFLVTRIGHHTVRPEEFALKMIECVDKSAITKALKEAKTLSKVEHENIVQLSSCHYIKEGTTNLVFMLTEYCSGGDLNFRLRRNSHSSRKLKWFYQLTSAIAYLHSQRPMIVHRDLKPANVLLTASDDIKVADFGFARQYEALRQLSSSASLHSYYMDSEVGTWIYMAPEVMNNHYTEKTDIFLLGIVFYAILEENYFPVSNSSTRVYGAFVNPDGKTPIGVAMYYKGNSSPHKELDFQATYKNYEGIPAEKLKRTVLKCLTYMPEERPKASDIREETNEMFQHLNTDSEEGKSYCALDSKNEAVQRQQNAYERGDDIVSSGSNTTDDFNSSEARNSEPIPNNVEYPYISINAGPDEELNGYLDCEKYEPSLNTVEDEINEDVSNSNSNSSSDEELDNYGYEDEINEDISNSNSNSSSDEEFGYEDEFDEDMYEDEFGSEEESDDDNYF